MSIPVLLTLLVLAALAARFNRPLARVHIALFKGSREAPSRWQMALLRSLLLVAGAAVFIAAMFALLDGLNS